MLIKEKCFIISCLFHVAFLKDYREWDNSVRLPRRITELMISYYDRTVQRVAEITPIRAKYEVSPHFELGYVISEILERYRKMIGHVKYPIDYAGEPVFETLKYTEMIQKHFLEIYHLVSMVHEIPRKYSLMKEFQEKAPYDRTEGDRVIIKLEESERQRERERKRRLKLMKKQRKLFMQGQLLQMPQAPKKPRNRWWPIDYGWEIDYQWW